MNAIPANSFAPNKPATGSRTLGELLVQAGHLKHEKVELVLFKQRRDGLLFGEAALRLGLIDEQQLEHALLLQYCPFGIPQAGAGLDASLHAALNPFGLEAEAIRKLRSQLTLRWFKNNKKVLAVIGSNDGDGCSAIAANLAISFAQLGEPTLLIDANLRRPAQHKLFGIDIGVGLSSVLAKRAAVKEALTSIPSLPGLTVMSAGPTPPNPQELLSSVMFNHVMETVPLAGNVIIIDTPALLDSADAQVIATKTGACLLSLRRHHSSADDVARVRELLAPTGVMLLGAVLND